MYDCVCRTVISIVKKLNFKSHIKPLLLVCINFVDLYLFHTKHILKFSDYEKKLLKDNF